MSISALNTPSQQPLPTRFIERLKQIGLFAAIESALFLSGILTILSPLPIIVAYGKEGFRHALAITVTAALIIFGFSFATQDDPRAFMPYISTGFMLTSLTLLGLMIGHGMNRGWKFSTLLTRPIIVLNALIVIPVVVIYGGMRGGLEGLKKDMLSAATLVQTQLAEMAQMLSNGGDEASEAVKQITQMPPQELTQLLIHQLPLAIFWAIALATWILVHSGIYFQLVREWKRLGHVEIKISMDDAASQNPVVNVPQELKPWMTLWRDTFTWRLPDAFIIPWLLCGGLAFVKALGPQANDVGILLFKILGTFYCFQGVSLGRFFLEKWQLPSLVRMLFYFSLIFVPSQVGFFVLMGLGILDFWMDFRKKFIKVQGVNL